MGRTTTPTLRTINHDSFCKVCDKVIKRNTTKVIAWYSFKNRGQHLYICQDCVREMYKLIN